MNDEELKKSWLNCFKSYLNYAVMNFLKSTTQSLSMKSINL